MRKLIVGALSILALAALPKPAEASQIVGTLQVSGGAAIINIGGGQTLIDFGVVQGCSVVPPAGTGCLDIQVQGTEGFFVPLTNEFDIVKDLSSAAFPTTGFAPLNQFQTITNTTVNFVLQDILSCPELGAGFVCLAPTSAFGFQQTALGTTVTMEMSGIVFDNQNIVSTWTAIFTAQFTGKTIADLVAEFNDPLDGSIQASISGTKVAVLRVPEPAMLTLLGSALLAGGFRARRRRQSAQ
jgi:hypothetical protein